MVSVPAVSDVAAVRDEVTITAEQPEMVLPFELNVTVPVGTGGLPAPPSP